MVYSTIYLILLYDLKNQNIYLLIIRDGDLENHVLHSSAINSEKILNLFKYGSLKNNLNSCCAKNTYLFLPAITIFQFF